MEASTVALAWPFLPSVLIGLLVLAAGYLLAITRWRGHFPDARPVPLGRALAFLAALGCLFLALHTPLEGLSDYLFSAHMVQHLLITLLAPPLLLYGTPGWLLRPLLRRWRFLASAGRALTKPLIAFGLFNAVFLLYHVPRLYDLTLESEPWHTLAHVVFIATGVITWWPVLSPLSEIPRLPYPAQMLYLFLQTLPQQILGAVLTFSSSVLYQRYAVAPRVWAALSPSNDQQLGGLLMWIGGSTFFLFAFALVFLRWAQLNEAGESAKAASHA